MRFEKKPDWLDIVSVAAIGVAAAAVVAGVVYISKKCRDYIECADLIDGGCDCEDDECGCGDDCCCDGEYYEDDCCCDDCCCEETGEDEDCACGCEAAPSIEEVVETECALDSEKE